MKTKKSVITLVWVLIVVMPAVSLLAQEMPVTTNSKEAKKTFLQGREKAENSQTIAAAELFDKAISLDPNFALAYAYRAQMGGVGTKMREHREKALSLIDKVSEGEKCLIQYLQASADGNQELRMQHINKFVGLYPKDKRAQTAYGVYLVTMQKYDAGIEAYNKAIQLDKNFNAAYNFLGYAYMLKKNWNESEKAFKRYIELQPNNPNPYDSYGDMLMKSGKFDDALLNYKKAYTLDPGFINALSRMGSAFIHKGEFDRAHECFREQFDKAPSYNWKIVAMSNDATAFLHEGKPDEAIKKFFEINAFAKSEKQDGGVLNALSNTGWIYVEMGDLANAALLAEQARTLTETADVSAPVRETQRLTRKFERVQLLMGIREFETADVVLAECKKMVDERKNPFELGNYHTLLGMVESAKGNYTKAMEAFTKSNADDPYAWFQKGLTQEKMGDRDGALKTYKDIITWNWVGLPYALVRYRAKQKVDKGFAVN